MAKVYAAKNIVQGRKSWFIYGHSRVGKTVMIGTFRPPILLTNFPNENGAETVANHSEVTVYEPETSQDIIDLPNWIAKENAKRVEQQLLPFGTIAVDSLTSWLELRQAELGRPLKLPSELHIIAQWTQDIVSLIDRLRACDAEKVYTATIQIREDRKTGVTRTGPALFQSLAQRVPAKVDATVLLESQTITDDKGQVRVERLAWFAPHDGMPAGIRGYAGPVVMANPSYGKILTEMKTPLFD